MTQRQDETAELHKLFTDALVAATGLKEAFAAQMMFGFLAELARRAGSSEIYIPKNPFRAERDELIRDDLGRGEPWEEIARRYDVTTRTVARIKARG